MAGNRFLPRSCPCFIGCFQAAFCHTGSRKCGVCALFVVNQRCLPFPIRSFHKNTLLFNGFYSFFPEIRLHIVNNFFQGLCFGIFSNARLFQVLPHSRAQLSQQRARSPSCKPVGWARNPKSAFQNGRLNTPFLQYSSTPIKNLISQYFKNVPFLSMQGIS